MKYINIVLLCCFLVVTTTVRTQSLESFFNKTDAFLNKNVKNGLVDYAGIKNNPQLLEELLNMAGVLQVSEENEKAFQAFYINGYNLHVIKGIVDNYPLESPLDVKGFFDTIKRDIGGKQLTLNTIENEVLRGNFPNESRFHFVLVCAGLGCPPIINEAYTPEKLDAQLERQTVRALNDPNFIRVKEDKVLLSQIFEWYKEDFVKNDQNEIDFINLYRKNPIDNQLKLGYYAYDWSLNDLK